MSAFGTGAAAFVDMAKTFVQVGANYGINAINNRMAAEREAQARAENYKYNEQAAQNADVRTRSLYYDLYSPKAQMQQIKDAGLSPSLFYGDMSGISGQAGAQSAGAAGVAPQSFGMSPVEIGNMALTAAQVEKLNAETANIKSQTTQTDLQNEAKELENTAFKQEWKIINSYVQNSNGEPSSLYDIAESCNTYDEFLTKVREIGKQSNPEFTLATETENGQRTLRGIYQANQQFGRDIAKLAHENVDADFQVSIIKCLEKANFAELNAKEAIQEINKNVETNKLDARQQEAWNNLIAKLEKMDSTTADIVIALLLTINNALTNYKMPNKGKAINITNNH